MTQNKGDEPEHDIETERNAPDEGHVIKDRFETEEVFQRIVAGADEEMGRTNRELFFSALAGGFAITLTFLLYAVLTAKTGGHPVLSAMMYPIGFVYIILGGYQLYTENTLPPVVLVLERLASVPALLRIWGFVMLGNFIGGALGATVLALTGVFSPDSAQAALEIASKGMKTPFVDLFFKAGFAGFIVAGVVWLDYTAKSTIARFAMIYFAFLAIPLGDLFHVVVTFTELTYLSILGEASMLYGLYKFLLPVFLGNTLGGVVLVTVVNYFQTTKSRIKEAREKGLQRQLNISECLFGGLAGRSYVPVDYEEVNNQERKA